MRKPWAPPFSGGVAMETCRCRSRMEAVARWPASLRRQAERRSAPRYPDRELCRNPDRPNPQLTPTPRSKELWARAEGLRFGTTGGAVFRAAVAGVAEGAFGVTGLAGAVAGFAAGVAGVADTPGPAFGGSAPLRSRPRATRKVPFACSTLIGLVSTRLAPMRNAFATPTCPSTTATASDDWFELELRALLNNSVAFCSLSQSTTTASKCCAINFLTAANGSLQGSIVKSRSLSTCVTVRAVFSSGQNSSAW